MPYSSDFAYISQEEVDCGTNTCTKYCQDVDKTTCLTVMNTEPRYIMKSESINNGKPLVQTFTPFVEVTDMSIFALDKDKFTGCEDDHPEFYQAPKNYCLYNSSSSSSKSSSSSIQSSSSSSQSSSSSIQSSSSSSQSSSSSIQSSSSSSQSSSSSIHSISSSKISSSSTHSSSSSKISSSSHNKSSSSVIHHSSTYYDNVSLASTFDITVSFVVVLVIATALASLF